MTPASQAVQVVQEQLVLLARKVQLVAAGLLGPPVPLEHRALQARQVHLEASARLDLRDRRARPAASDQPEPPVLRAQVHRQTSCR